MIENILSKLTRIASTDVRETLLTRDENSEFDRELWRKICSAGIFRLLVPESLGGLGGTHKDFGEAIKVFTYSGQDSPLAVSLVAHGICVDILVTFGSRNQIVKYLAGMVDGNLIAALSNAEVGAGTDLKAAKSFCAYQAEGNYRLEVNKRGITNLGKADLAFAGLWLHENEKQTMEVFALEVGEKDQTDNVSQIQGFNTGLTGDLAYFRDITSYRGLILGERKSGFKIFNRIYSLERYWIPCALEGIVDSILEEVIEFTQKRRSGGKAIAEYQFTQEKIYEIYRIKETMTGLRHKINSDIDRESQSWFHANNAFLSMMKVYGVDCTFKASTLLMELHGYVAYLKGNINQKTLRDAGVLKTLGGTKELHKMTVNRDLLGNTKEKKNGEPIKDIRK